MTHDSEPERARKASALDWDRTCTCKPVNRAPFAGVCGTCGNTVAPSCACWADARERAPGHVVMDAQSSGRCLALVETFGLVCDYCRARCGGALPEGRLG